MPPKREGRFEEGVVVALRDAAPVGRIVPDLADEVGVWTAVLAKGRAAFMTVVPVRADVVPVVPTVARLATLWIVGTVLRDRSVTTPAVSRPGWLITLRSRVDVADTVVSGRADVPDEIVDTFARVGPEVVAVVVVSVRPRV